MINRNSPLNALQEGRWFKLICGASFQHLPAVRNLALVYTLAGADCIDVAADPAVIAAAEEGRRAASRMGEIAPIPNDAASRSLNRWRDQTLPWLMVSLNDGEDPHFRKAEFNPSACPTDCWRPCEQICPAQAIVFSPTHQAMRSGVIDERCYGCGRCLPVCPSQLIYTRSYLSTPATIAPWVLKTDVDALEIHTQVGRETDFKRLWQQIQPWVHQLKLIAISCPDGVDLIDYLWALYDIISPWEMPLIWQTDGRPMSGDIGDGTTLAAVKLGQKVLEARLPGYVQVAGGTNAYTVTKLKATGLLHQKNTPAETAAKIPSVAADSSKKQGFFPSPITDKHPYIAGIAVGSYARVLLSPILEQLEIRSERGNMTSSDGEETMTPVAQLSQIEAHPDLLWQAVNLARSLVAQIKEED